ncbi:MAG: hypothetical protein B7X39_00795 [Lysobacterales bacterium 14-68-21]|jgi:hypothetical protein|nr:MAG: hypothetical protein B7X45_02565 [Xanthomonadales bacterium 15-68-25]OZB68421.1 MAG: hypothetical protein B7X39_00795 [Xanthomonadales bacterium 14-68-21]
MNQLDRADTVYCANCGTAMEGEFCHHCGQSVHSVLKPVHHMLEDGMDMVLHVDGRIVHTLPPLLLKPGFLTLEYFAGRRVRYIAPFRLMFVLCLLAFAVCHMVLDAPSPVTVNSDRAVRQALAAAQTPAEVRQVLDRQIAQLEAARKAAGTNAAALTAVGLAEARLRTAAADRQAELERPAPAGKDSAARAKRDDTQAADVHDDPVEVSWLPEFANRRLTVALEHMRSNMRVLRRGDPEARERVVAQLFSSIPQALLVMLPLFALLLKLFYLFKRRLYMEHLIVALHSHAFLFLALLLGVGLAELGGWLIPLAAWTAAPIHALGWALALWVPIYLLLMQKRIYRQGWGMTLVKYLAVGWCYLWLLMLALLLALAIGLSH